MDCDANVLTEIQSFLETSGILVKDWKKGSDNTISMLSKKNHVNDQIDLIDNRDENEWMKKLYSKRTFPFTYDGIADINPNHGHDIDPFGPRQNVAAEFSTHAINFKSTAKPDGTFNYNFCLRNIYLVDGGLTISTPKKRKQGPDEWVDSSPKTRKTNVQANISHCSPTNSGPE